jgi:hypothetical protein
MRAGYVDLPEGWSRGAGVGFGPFVTREEFHRADGAVRVWESRWHRKHPGGSPSGSTWWAPRALGWWIGVLFAIGSACFAIAALPPFAVAVGTNPDNVTYFIGSLFFTSAAFLLYVETASTDTNLDSSHRRGIRFLFKVEHRRIDWWAAAIQLLGTLWFNRTTLSALIIGLGHSAAHHPVWRPDAFGSICFLISSWLAWAEVCHGPFAWHPTDVSWGITALNLVGSLAFGVSAVASYVRPTGQIVSLAVTNLGTFVGAICFLAGAVLLLPERTAGSPARSASGPAPSTARR